MKGKGCELCDGGAVLYCLSDSSFLCWTCDAKVHEANFLVARHVRHSICSKCKGLIADDPISGVGIGPLQRMCTSCSPEGAQGYLDSSSSSSSSSDCISSSESFPATASLKKSDFDRVKRREGIVSSSSLTEVSADVSTERTKGRKSGTTGLRSWADPAANVDSKAEVVLVNWCRRLGLTAGVGQMAVPVASRAFGLCLDGFAVMRFRVSLAASLWCGLRFCGNSSASTWQALKKLEGISGVPAELILAAESKLARALKKEAVIRPRSRRQQLEQHVEGWGEC